MSCRKPALRAVWPESWLVPAGDVSGAFVLAPDEGHGQGAVCRSVYPPLPAGNREHLRYLYCLFIQLIRLFVQLRR